MTDRVSQKYYLRTLNNFSTALEKVAWQLTGGKSLANYSCKWYLEEMKAKQDSLYKQVSESTKLLAKIMDFQVRREPMVTKVFPGNHSW